MCYRTSTPASTQQGSAQAVDEVLFRAGLTTPSEVEHAVRAAQAAILSGFPTRLPWNKGGGHRSTSSRELQVSVDVGIDSQHLSASTPVSPAQSVIHAKFSRDVVVVEIKGAPVDLTLIDLPGIIQNVERPEDDHYRVLVCSLAASYMQRPGCIIVATITCKEDIDTQVIRHGCSAKHISCAFPSLPSMSAYAHKLCVVVVIIMHDVYCLAS